VAVQEVVAGGFAEGGITDDDRDDMARRRQHRQAGLGKAPLSSLPHAPGDGRARAGSVSDGGWRRARPAARAGGNEVVKMNLGAWLRRKSTSTAEPATCRSEHRFPMPRHAFYTGAFRLPPEIGKASRSGSGLRIGVPGAAPALARLL
jgi:hypothetical protein